MQRVVMVAAVLLACAPVMASGPEIALGSRSVDAGRTAAVEVTFAPGNEPVSALTADVTFDPSALTPVGVETVVPGKVAQGNLVSPGIYRITLFGGADPLPTGTVATLHFAAARDRCGVFPLAYAAGGPSASTPQATGVALVGRAGRISVEKCEKRGEE